MFFGTFPKKAVGRGSQARLSERVLRQNIDKKGLNRWMCKSMDGSGSKHIWGSFIFDQS